MIRKPSGAQQEDRLHAAVGSVIETGASVRAAGRTAQKAGRKVGLHYIFGMMGFGLLFSSTPIWFKLILFGGGWWIFKVWKNWLASQDARSEQRATPRKPDGSDSEDLLHAAITTLL